MKVTTERLDNCQVNVIVEMDAAEIDKKLRETARKLARQFTVPGYRKGRAPFHAVVRVFGREAVQQQMLEDFGNDWYEQALDEPEVDLGDYRSVRVPFEPEPITDERIDEYLANLQQEYAQWVPVERPAQLGDQVVLDVQGTAGDVEVMNNEGSEMILEAEAEYPVPGFHDQVVGMSAGEEKTFTVTMPENEDEDIAGKEATVTVKLYSVKEEDLPPLDDELAMMVGDYDTLDELKAATRESMETEALQKAESEYLDSVLEALIEAADKIEYPPQAVDRETEFALNQMEQSLASSGITLDRFLVMIGKTRDAYKQDIRPSAEDRLKKRLVLNKVAELERLTVEEDEIEAEIDRVSESMGDQAEQMREVLETPGGRLSVADDLMVGKVQERVTQIGKGEAPPLEEEEPEEAEAEAEAETEDEDAASEAPEGESEPKEEVAGDEADTEEA
jgi:trigger factor